MIRNYKGTDIDEIINIWNGAMPRTPINRKFFVKNFLLDLNFDVKAFFVGVILLVGVIVLRKFNL